MKMFIDIFLSRTVPASDVDVFTRGDILGCGGISVGSVGDGSLFNWPSFCRSLMTEGQGQERAGR